MTKPEQTALQAALELRDSKTDRPVLYTWAALQKRTVVEWERDTDKSASNTATGSDAGLHPASDDTGSDNYPKRGGVALN